MFPDLKLSPREYLRRLEACPHNDRVYIERAWERALNRYANAKSPPMQQTELKDAIKRKYRGEVPYSPSMYDRCHHEHPELLPSRIPYGMRPPWEGATLEGDEPVEPAPEDRAPTLGQLDFPGGAFIDGIPVSLQLTKHGLLVLPAEPNGGKVVVTVSTDRYGMAVRCNDAFCRLMHLPRNRVIDNPAERVLRPSGNMEDTQCLVDAGTRLKNGESREEHVDTWFEREDGTRIEIHDALMTLDSRVEDIWHLVVEVDISYFSTDDRLKIAAIGLVTALAAMWSIIAVLDGFDGRLDTVIHWCAILAQMRVLTI